jgi:copper chaperone NosL
MRPRAALAAAVLALAACRGDAPGGPPRYVSGRDACARCGMAVSEARFAGGWVDETGASVVFDDPGELLAALRESPERVRDAWTGDYETGAWVRAGEAFFVRAPGLATPMGTGTAAFADRARAEAFARSRPGAETVEIPKEKRS